MAALDSIGLASPDLTGYGNGSGSPVDEKEAKELELDKLTK